VAMALAHVIDEHKRNMGGEEDVRTVKDFLHVSDHEFDQQNQEASIVLTYSLYLKNIIYMGLFLFF